MYAQGTPSVLGGLALAPEVNLSMFLLSSQSEPSPMSLDLYDFSSRLTTFGPVFLSPLPPLSFIQDAQVFQDYTSTFPFVISVISSQ